MELNKLYDIADKENIPVINFKMKNKAIIGKVGKKYCIGLNYSKIDSSREEKELLTEELSHYYSDSFYSSNSDPIVISKKEYRANKLKCTILVTVNDFRQAIKNGLYTLYEISEYLNVSEQTVEFAYNYYKNNNYI